MNKSKEYIRAAIFFKWRSASVFPPQTDADPFEIYRALRVVNPSPYMYFLKLNDLAVVGSSPEMLREGAGPRCLLSAHRRDAPARRMKKKTGALEANRRRSQGTAEHIMLVDLGRNDLGRVSSTARCALRS